MSDPAAHDECLTRRRHLLDRLRLLSEMAFAGQRDETNPEWKNFYGNLQTACTGYLKAIPPDEVPCEECGREASQRWLDLCRQIMQSNPVPGYCERCLQRLEEGAK